MYIPEFWVGFAVRILAEIIFVIGLLAYLSWKGKKIMKQPKKPTREQKSCMKAHMLNPKEWAFVEETGFYFRIINKRSGATKMIDKFKRCKR